MKKEKHKKTYRTLGPCEASVHDHHCNGLATSEDHQTGRSIAKMFREKSPKEKRDWSKKQTESSENKQNLNLHCHKLKDNDTIVNLKILNKAHNGGITLDEFLEMKKPYRVAVVVGRYRQKKLTEVKKTC